MNVRACIFDLDGVIVDTAKYHFAAWSALAGELGFEFTEAHNEQLKGVSRMDSLDILLSVGGMKEQFTPQEKEQLAERKNTNYLKYIERMTTDEILPGVVDLMNELRELKLGIALGSASKNAQLILRRIGLIDCFDQIVDGNQITLAKPDPEVFLKGAQLLGVPPSECIVFEDAAAGIQAATRAGMRSVGVGQPEILFAATVVVPSLEGFTTKQLNRI